MEYSNNCTVNFKCKHEVTIYIALQSASLFPKNKREPNRLSDDSMSE